MRIVTNRHMTGFRVQRLESSARPDMPPWVNLYLQDGDRETDSLIELTSVAECDELITAACEAKRLLSPPPETPADAGCPCGHLGAQHVYGNPESCTQCGCPAFGTPVTDEAAPKDGPLSVDCPSCGAPAGRYCTSDFGCTARAYRAYGEPDGPSPAAIVAKAIETGEPPAAEWAARFGPYCTAGYEPFPGHRLLCELKPGHDGHHRSLGYQDGDPDITWTEETAPAGAA